MCPLKRVNYSLRSYICVIFFYGVSETVIQNASKKWTMPIQNWGLTLSQLAIFFEDRLDDVIEL